jgi:hypothetical protein
VGQARVYIKPFGEDGQYVDDWMDVTKYVNKIGEVSIDSDSADFQLGVFRQSNVKLALNNREGLFSDVDFSDSIFRYKRTDSQVKMTWDLIPDPARCGMVYCGQFYTSEELEMFKGLLSDESFTENAKTEVAEFYALGFESVFSRVDTPYSLLAAGDTIKTLIYTILNQTTITDLLTVELANIDPDLNLATDAVASLENKTVREALNVLLQISNSVLYIEDDTIYVSSREETADLKQTFYGQASTAGAENLVTADKISNGLNRTFNYWTWAEATNRFSVDSSINIYGVRKRELDSELFTNTTKRDTILQTFAGEFGDPKQELEIKTKLNYTSLARDLLDKVNIDYPTILVQSPGFDMPICGIAICGEAVLPRGLWSFSIPSTRYFKITKKQINFDQETLMFKLREV